MADIEIVEDNTKEAQQGIQSAIDRALEKIGMTAEGYAKKLCPVDTGRLRNSITHTTQEKTVYIGTNVEYGPFVELGTSKRKEKPYLRPAARDHGEQYRSILKGELSK